MLFLKQQEHRQQQTTSEQKKLQNLRDAVEKQEAQLKMVRALKGQVEQKRLSNGKLGERRSSVVDHILINKYLDLELMQWKLYFVCLLQLSRLSR